MKALTLELLAFSAIGLLGLATVYIIIPFVYVAIIKRQCKLDCSSNQRRLYLTFDDGPDPFLTEKVLDLLKSYNAKATFFVVGKRIREHPGIAKRILSEGHIIGAHGYAHVHPWKSGPLRTLVDFVNCRRAFTLLGLHNYLKICRLPYGKTNLVQMIFSLASKVKLFFWHIDPRDYDGESAEEVAACVIQRARPGAIVLFHDGRLRQNESSRSVTEEAVKIVLHTMSNAGYTFSSLDDGRK